jgi:hypothetical protein
MAGICSVVAQEDLSDEELDALMNDEAALDAWLEEEFTGWDFTAFVRTGLGHSDNVLLATVNPLEGEYLRTDLELLLMRFPDDNGEFFSFVSGSDLRYPNVEDADKEQIWLWDTEWKRYLGDRINANFIAQYIFFNQILDLSLSERQVSRQRVEYQGYGLGGELEFDAGGQNILSLGLTGFKEDYKEVLGQNWKGVLELGVRRPLWQNSEWEATLGKDVLDYDDRVQRDEFGRPLDETLLKTYRSSASLEYIQQWGKKRAIESILKLEYLENRDNGSGYYDFDQWSFEASIEGTWSRFEASLSLGHDDSEFLVQRAERFSTTPRMKDDYFAELFFKKDLSKRYSVYLMLEYEDSQSNVQVEEYDALSGSIGLQINLWGDP